MSNVGTLFEAFYDQFIMRDIVAKVLPGTLFLSTIFLLLSNSVKYFYLDLNQIPSWTWVMFITFSWIVGFAIQGIAEKMKMIRYYPKWEDEEKTKKLTEKEWYGIYIDFQNNVQDKTIKQTLERFIVIKEACGNVYSALFFSIILFVSYLGLEEKIFKNNFFNMLKENVFPFFIFLIFITITLSLWYMHKIHVKRQYNLVVKYLEKISLKDKEEPNIKTELK